MERKSIWEEMSDEQLEDRLREMQAELQALEDSIGRVETELYLRKEPNIRNPIVEFFASMFNKRLLPKVRNENLGLLTPEEISDETVLQKMIDWQEDYPDVPWEEFKEHWWKCSRCGGYSDHQCICYAR